MNPITSFTEPACVLAGSPTGSRMSRYLGLTFFAAAMIIALPLKMANSWQAFVIRGMGKPPSVKRAGTISIISILDNVIAVIDERIQATGFNAEQALTRDRVPVNVDTIIFWHVHAADSEFDDR